MELLESIGWIALGFVPTLFAMEIGWKITKRLKLYTAKGVAGRRKVSMESGIV